MELTLDQKHALLARLAAQQHPAYNPATDIAIEDMQAQLAAAGRDPSRNVAVRLLADAAEAGELRAGWAVRNGKKIRVYRQADV